MAQMYRRRVETVLFSAVVLKPDVFHSQTYLTIPHLNSATFQKKYLLHFTSSDLFKRTIKLSGQTVAPDQGSKII